MSELLMDLPPQIKTETTEDKAKWAAELKRAETAVLNQYTIIYRSVDGELHEAWHSCTDYDLEEWVKPKYKKAKKDIIKIVEKRLAFGEYLNTISGSSKK